MRESNISEFLGSLSPAKLHGMMTDAQVGFSTTETTLRRIRAGLAEGMPTLYSYAPESFFHPLPGMTRVGSIVHRSGVKPYALDADDTTVQFTAMGFGSMDSNVPSAVYRVASPEGYNSTR